MAALLVAVFEKASWTKPLVVEFLQGASLDADLRMGFNRILALLPLECLDSFPRSAARELVLLAYDWEENTGSTEARRIGPQGASPFDPTELLETGLLFELKNMGFVPIDSGDLQVHQEALARGVASLGKAAPVARVDGAEAALALDLDGRPRRLLLDCLVLRASAIQILMWGANSNEKAELQHYTQIVSVTFLVRAQTEKLMLLCGHVDPELEYERLTGKRVRQKFLDMARGSDLEVTKRIAAFVEGISILDENYRTPEAHKTGRNWGLVCSGYHESLSNEVMGYLNELQPLVSSVCEELSRSYPD